MDRFQNDDRDHVREDELERHGFDVRLSRAGRSTEHRVSLRYLQTHVR